uniref:Uncharacterized protein n=1 Tax=Helianthus annuus TaxID=4232 RepID=A0A251VKA9_HELAN
MESSEVVDGADVVIPLASVKQVTDRYANTLYGYFLGKRLAFPRFRWWITLLRTIGLSTVWLD